MNPETRPTILEEIYERRKKRVDAARSGFEYGEFVARARNFRKDKTPHRFRAALTSEAGPCIIAEIKRASPSKGLIRENPDIGELAAGYEAAGAGAISVLTEEEHFLGSVEDLMIARNLTDLPVLRKDFIFDEFQVYESGLIGADAILLIAAMLDDERLRTLSGLASELGLDVLLETHDAPEMERAVALGAEIIGVNNRNLHTFEVSLDVSREMIRLAPEGAVLVCESGLRRGADIREMHALGYRGFLIGETLMRAADIKEKMEELTGA